MIKKLSLLSVLLSGVFWGSSALFVSSLTELGFSSFECTSIRLTLTVPMMHVILLLSGRKNYKINVSLLITFALCGILSVLTMCICYFYAMTLTSAAVSTVLLYTSPIFVMIMSVIFFRERLTLKKFTALILAFLGCVLTSGIIGGIKGSLIGVLIGLLSGFSYSLYSIFSAISLKKGASPLTCTAFSFTFAAIGAQFISNPISLVKKIADFPDLPALLVLMITFSLCSTVLPFILYTLGLASLKPDVAAMAASTDPVVASLVGIFILKQGTDIFQIIGILLVIAAIIVLNLNIKKEPKKSKKIG